MERRSSLRRMFLHDAIAEILMTCPCYTADCEHIAQVNRRRRLYLRRKDNQPPEAWQIRLRARKRQYSHMFEILDGDRVKLKDEWRDHLIQQHQQEADAELDQPRMPEEP